MLVDALGAMLVSVALVATGFPPASAPVSVASPASQASTTSTTSASSATSACDGAPIAPFVDVRPDGVHGPSVDCVFWYDVAAGVQVDAYRPDGDVRRDQMAGFVARAVQASSRALAPAQKRYFDDIAGNVHAWDIKRLAEAGIVQGREPRVYDPEASVPRGQMTAFLVRAYEFVTGERVEASGDYFDDDAAHVHEATINAAAELGLASGKSHRRFAPDELTDREQMASFLARLLDRLAADGWLEERPRGYEAVVSVLPVSLRKSMKGVSWHEDCPVRLDDLRFVEIVHRDLDDTRRWGQLVVHRDVTGDIAKVFEAMYADGFAVERVQRIERYGGSDDRSMEANNTSAFNCRRVTGGSSWSQHAYGTAIDINPVQNPYVNGDEVKPEEGRRYLDRDDVRPGMIVRPGVVTAEFDWLGWEWGGDWSSLKDYQHFSHDGG